jgi:hypothetical protein
MFSPETNPIITALAPQAASTIADVADWVCLKNAKGCYIVVQYGGAGDTDPVFTVHEGATGTGTTAITTGAEFPIWKNEACTTTDALTRATDALTFTIDGNKSGGTIQLFVMYVPASILSAGYDWIQLGSTAGNAASFVSALYILDGERYQQGTPPTAIA